VPNLFFNILLRAGFTSILQIITSSESEEPWSSGKGRRLMTKRSWVKPALWTPFFKHYSLGSKLGTNIVENSKLALLHVL